MAGRGAVDAAAREIHEPLHADLLGFFCQFHRAEVIDLEGDLRIELPYRIVAEFSEMHDRFEPTQIVLGNVANVLVNGRGHLSDAVVKPADAMKPRIQPRDVVSAIHHVWSENRSDVSV